MKVNILGTTYSIKYMNKGKDETFEENDWCGYCSNNPKAIVILNLNSLPEWKKEKQEIIQEAQNTTLRHEIVHAFLNESGLQCCSYSPRAWAKNEEMVDWIATQSPKIFKAFKETNCI